MPSKDDSNELVTLFGFIKTVWQDEYRIWNSSFPYGCIGKSVLPSPSVWIPDIVIYNTEQQFLPKDRNREDIVITSDGMSARTFSGAITFYCALNMAWFPFDTQTCSFQMESWALDMSEQFFAPYGPGTVVLNGSNNEEWNVNDFKLTITEAGLTSKFSKVIIENMISLTILPIFQL